MTLSLGEISWMEHQENHPSTKKQKKTPEFFLKGTVKEKTSHKLRETYIETYLISL